MTAAEQKLLERYRASLKRHGYRGVALHRAAKLCLRAASAGAHEVAPGNQRRSKYWKTQILPGAHKRAIAALAAMASP